MIKYVIEKSKLKKGYLVYVIENNYFLPSGPFVVEKEDIVDNSWVHLVGRKCKRRSDVYISEKLAKKRCIRKIERRIETFKGMKKRLSESIMGQRINIGIEKEECKPT